MGKHQLQRGDEALGADRKLVLTIYRDGFVVGERGEFRPSSDPKNKAFLDQVIAGRDPDELAAGGADLDLHINDKRGEDYKEPGGGMGRQKPKPTDWSKMGEGNSLGGGSSSGAAVAVSASSGAITV